MKTGNNHDVKYKEVVIIGNGPSGIALSYMLSGNLPYLTSNSHPDEMLTLRLESSNQQNKCLLKRDLRHLATGLEGRSTNPISLLLDALLKPYADIGFEMAPLLEFRKSGIEIDHVVLGKGPPGGSWHKMDPYILTLSLASWMALPGLQFISNDSGEKRALAKSVAKYYVDYVKTMNLSSHFTNNVQVRNVIELKNRSSSVSIDDPTFLRNLRTNSTNSINCSIRRSKCCFKRSRDFIFGEKKQRRDRSVSFTSACDYNLNYDRILQNERSEIANRMRNSYSLEFQTIPRLVENIVPSSLHSLACDDVDSSANWLIESHDVDSGEIVTYKCRYLVLANGISDLPNRLDFNKDRSDPDWVFHDLRSLEFNLDVYYPDLDVNEVDIEPVLVVGAGLSAADAIIALRGRNVPVCHVFRNRVADLNRKLPENMYPEYHKVHQMMQDGGSTYPNYLAYAEHSVESIDETNHSVILRSKNNERIKLRVSFIIILIGSRPDLAFLPSNMTISALNRSKNASHALKIDKMTHLVNGFDNLFAIGPLADDNFVRFIPGGAFAVVNEIYRNNTDWLSMI